MSNRANVKRIRQTLLKKLSSDPGASFEDTVEALADMLTLYMSMVCESCRKRLADELVRAAPIMLERANRKAEQMTASDPARSLVCDIRHAKVADTATNKAAARRTIRATIRLATKRRVVTEAEVLKRILKGPTT